jgi:hypothetical protein
MASIVKLNKGALRNLSFDANFVHASGLLTFILETPSVKTPGFFERQSRGPRGTIFPSDL